MYYTVHVVRSSSRSILRFGSSLHGISCTLMLSIMPFLREILGPMSWGDVDTPSGILQLSHLYSAAVLVDSSRVTLTGRPSLYAAIRSVCSHLASPSHGIGTSGSLGIQGRQKPRPTRSRAGPGRAKRGGRIDNSKRPRSAIIIMICR